jgi:hypothetical protein
MNQLNSLLMEEVDGSANRIRSGLLVLVTMILLI